MAAGITILFTLAASHPAPAAQRDIAWQSSFAAARASALQSGKPLFVVFRCER
jgi:hypothetical protein